MERKYKIVLSILLVMWLFATGLIVSKHHVESNAAEISNASATDQSLAQTEDNYTAAFENATPEASSTTAVVAATTAAATDGETPESWTEKTVLRYLCKAISGAENTKNQTVTENKLVNMSISDCSQSSLKIALNNIVQIYAGERETTYKFKNGIATNYTGESVTPKDVLLPIGDHFSLDVPNISYAAAEQYGKSVRITVTIGKETVDYKDTPVNHGAGIGRIDFSKLDLSPATLTAATVTYERTTITAVIRPNGTLVSLSGSLPVEINCEGKLGKAFEATVAGSVSYSWTFG